MKKLLWMLTGLLFAGAGAFGTSLEEEVESILATDEHRVIMSVNLKVPDDDHPWEDRRAVMVNMMKRYQPLFIGTQEGLQDQLQYIESNMPAYDYIGVSRQGGTEDEYSAIFFDTERVTARDNGTFWLSESPDEPGSMSFGAAHPRIATWGRFSVAGYDREVYVFNTHLSFETEVTAGQAEVLIEQIGRIAGNQNEVLVTGDFNVPRNTHVWGLFQDAGFSDAWQLARHEDGPSFTRHDWEGTEADLGEHRIDWILFRDAQLPDRSRDLDAELVVKTVGYNRNGIYPSDHFPVVLSTLGEATIESADLSLGSESVRAGDQIDVSATIRNTGGRGIAPVALYVDRKVIDTEWISLAAVERQIVSFKTVLYEPGDHSVSIDLLPAKAVSVEPAPPRLNLSGFSTSIYVEPGDSFATTGTVTNSGSFLGTQDFSFVVDDETRAVTTVSVRPGQTQQVGFALSFDSPGAHTITLGENSREISVYQSIAGTWLFHEGDQSQWKNPGFDDSDWEQVQLPASWEDHSDYTADEVYGWYRGTVVVPQEWEGQPVRLLLGMIDDADKTYLNGELVAETGRFPDDEEGFLSRWDSVRVYEISPDVINYGEENVVAVRVYDEYGGGGIHDGPLGILPLDE